MGLGVVCRVDDRVGNWVDWGRGGVRSWMGWLVGWLADWLVGWLVWLLGWLVGGWVGGVFSQDISPRYISHKQGWQRPVLIQYKASSQKTSIEISSGVFASIASVADAAG